MPPSAMHAWGCGAIMGESGVDVSNGPPRPTCDRY